MGVPTDVSIGFSELLISTGTHSIGFETPLKKQHPTKKVKTMETATFLICVLSILLTATGNTAWSEASA
jgi:hypothetical protein